jgi:hypothetical protein
MPCVGGWVVASMARTAALVLVYVCELTCRHSLHISAHTDKLGRSFVDAHSDRVSAHLLHQRGLPSPPEDT